MRPETFRINSLPPYYLGLIAADVLTARLEGKDIIDLSQANPALPPPAAAKEGLVQASLLPHHHRYSASKGVKKLRQSICSYYKRRFGVELDSESEVLSTLGTKEGIFHFLVSILTPGDSVLVPTPSYPVHRAAVSLCGGVSRGVELEKKEILDEKSCFFETLQSVIDSTWPRPKMLLMNFPHNPTTTVVNLGFFERLVDIAKAADLILVHDLSYAEICFSSYRAPSLLQVPGAKDISLEFYSMSKAFSIAGWRIGFALGNPELISSLAKLKSYVDFGIFQPLQIGAVAALQNAESILADNLASYSTRQEIFIRGLKKLNWEFFNPLATLFVWSKIPEKYRHLGSIEFSKLLLKEARVAVSPGKGFDDAADDFIRFALVESEGRLREALSRLEKFLKN